MSDKKNQTKTIDIIFRPAPPVLKVVVIVLILVSVAALGTLRVVHLGIQEQNLRLRDEAAALEYANAALIGKTGSPDSVRNVQAIAKEELGLVNPDTIVIDPIS